MRGIYELSFIQKKTMNAVEYKKRVEKLDKLTDNLSDEKIEKQVSFQFLYLFF